MVLILVKYRYFQIVFHVEVNITCVVFFLPVALARANLLVDGT